MTNDDVLSFEDTTPTTSGEKPRDGWNSKKTSNKVETDGRSLTSPHYHFIRCFSWEVALWMDCFWMICQRVIFHRFSVSFSQFSHINLNTLCFNFSRWILPTMVNILLPSLDDKFFLYLKAFSTIYSNISTDSLKMHIRDDFSSKRIIPDK